MITFLKRTNYNFKFRPLALSSLCHFVPSFFRLSVSPSSFNNIFSYFHSSSVWVLSLLFKKIMRHLLLAAMFFVLISSLPIRAVGCPITSDTIIRQADSIPSVNLQEIEIISRKNSISFWTRWRLNRLIRNVKKVYPYAKTAGALLRVYNVRLEHAKNDAERKRIMKQAEKEIKVRYGNSLKKLTFSQGFILIKLIDRETGNTSYGLLQQLRGKFTAFFYQAFARIWGYNLKTRYDPEGKDRQIEAIVRLIEAGKL